MQRIQPVPEDLIRRWEDHHFINLYDHWQQRIVSILKEENNEIISELPYAQVLAPSLGTIYKMHARISTELQNMVAACRGLLSRGPHLLRIFQARRLLFANDASHIYPLCSEILQIRTALDLSWDDIQRYICVLRPLATQSSDFIHKLVLFLPTLCRELDSLCPEAIVSRDLASGFIRLMQLIESGDLPRTYR
jgi:hypothetical protein